MDYTESTSLSIASIRIHPLMNFKLPMWLPPAALIVPFLATASFSQVLVLGLASGSAPANGSISLNLELTGGTQPAGLQWTLNYSPEDFNSINITSGASSDSALKSLSCFGGSGTRTCLITGINSTTISNGVVATITLALSSGTNISRSIQIANTMAVALSASPIAITGSGGTVTSPVPVPDTEAPTPPDSLSIGGVNGTQISLIWSPSADNVSVAGYPIERCQGVVCLSFRQIATTSEMFYQDSGLLPNTPYRYRVRAVDAAGNLSAYSSPAGAVTGSATSSTFSVFPPDAVPAVVSEPDQQPVEVGMKFRTSIPGFVSGVRFYKGSLNTGTHSGSLWTNSGVLLARVSFSSETPAGWQQANFTTPVAILANTTYVISYHAPFGRYSMSVGQFSGSGVDSGPLHALRDGEDGANGVYKYGAGDFPAETWQSTNYWVDVVFVPQGTVTLPVLSNLECAPVLLPPGSSAGCRVSLTGAAPAEGVSVALSASPAGLLIIPASVMVPAGQTSVSFNAQAGTSNTGQAVFLKASYGGVSKLVTVRVRSASATGTTERSIWSASSVPEFPAVNDTAPVELGVKFRSSVPGYVTGLKFYKGPGNTGPHIGRLWSNGGALLARTTFANESGQGWQQAELSPPVYIQANATYVASYYTPKGHYSLSRGRFAASSATNDTLRALQSGEDGDNGVYRYGEGFPDRSRESSEYGIDVVFVAQPSPAAPLLRAGSLSCSPKLVQAGGSFRCVLILNADDAANGEAIPIGVSGTHTRLPSELLLRSGRRTVAFHGTIDPTAPQSLVQITAGREGGIEERISLIPAALPALSLPDVLYVRPGDAIAFTATAQDGTGLPVGVSVSGLPPGALFNQVSGQFRWTPSLHQEGEYSLVFIALDDNDSRASGQTRIVVGLGSPRVKAPREFSCAAGSMATLEGQWLSTSGASLSDKSGASLELGGTTIYANGRPVPVLRAGPTRVDFLCPHTASGEPVMLQVETSLGASMPFPVTVVEVQPILLRIDGSETEGLITAAETDRFAVVRDVRGLGEPTHRNDIVVVRVTGLPAASTQIAGMTLTVGGIAAPIQSVLPDQAAAGIYGIRLKVPPTADTNNETAVQLTIQTPAGRRLTSNIVTMAVE